jgi:hypothetical protein
MKYWLGFAFAILCAALLSVWQWGLNSIVLSYGEAKSSYFSPSEASPEEKIKLCFDDVTWYKICPSILTTYFKPSSGPRIDLPSYFISLPASTGKVPPKCREWTVPKVAKGTGVLSGFARHKCFFESRTILPNIKLEIK